MFLEITAVSLEKIVAGGIISIIAFLFQVFLYICAVIVLVKLAFGTLHIHVSIDNLDEIPRSGVDDTFDEKEINMEQIEKCFEKDN